MTIRWRLTLWFALILLVILILFGVLLDIFLQYHLTNEVDKNLLVHSARVHGIPQPQVKQELLDFHVLHANFPLIDEFTSPGIYIQLIDGNGDTVIKSENLGGSEIPFSPTLIQKGYAGKVDIETVPTNGGGRLRIMVSPLYLNDRTLLLEVAESLKQVDDTLSQVRWVVWLGALIALTGAGITGSMLVRRSLYPVERIRATARSIEASFDLSRRVDYKGPMDEIGRLATTFDQMIEHLEKAFRSQKFFVADASHELRGPLTVIRGNLDLLKRNIGEQDRQEGIKAIGAETDRMVKIVEELLLLAEVESNEPERKEVVSLTKIVETELRRARQLSSKHQFNLGRFEDLSIRGSAHRIQQLVSNLVDNSIRYTPEGGSITLSVFRDDNWACLQVTDTGVGIAPEDQPYVFDRFYRTDKARSRARGGLGLGLAIVKGIAEQHGGTVTVSSQPGRGSTFVTFLKF